MILESCDSLPACINADVCIVGAGPAGIAIARSWLGTSIRVCLIESGGLQPDAASQELYEGAATGDASLDPAASRLRAFGGGTQVWGGGCIPLGSIDFSHRAWVPHSGWPLSYEQLEPYYAQARSLFGIESHAFVEGSFVAGPAAHGLGTDNGVLQNRHFIRSPVFFGQRFRDELAHAKNVQLLLHAHVLSLESCAQAAHIRAIKVRLRSGRTVDVAAKQYILACGGIENARLMLLSDSVAPAGIGNTHDLVGRYFMDHPSGRLGTLQTGTPESVTRPYERTARGAACFPELCLSPATLRQHAVLSARARPMAVEGPAPRGVEALRELRHALRRLKHDEAMSLDGRMQTFEWIRNRTREARSRRSLRSVGKAALTLGFNAHHIAQAWQRKRTGRLPVPAERVDVVGYFEQAPNPDSRVRLGEDIDALGQRKVVVDWRLTQLDWHTYRTSAALFGAQLAGASCGLFTPDAWLQGQVGDSAPVHGSAHHMGTTRMSADPREGVVDLQSRVHGVSNLHVAGSSVFPTGGWAFPTFTLVAMSLRLAEYVHFLL